MRRWSLHQVKRATIADIDPSERYSIERPCNGTYARDQWGHASYRWTPLAWSEVDSVSYSRVSPDKNGGWLMPSLLTWSDYSGSTVERSNYETFVEDFASVRTRENGRPNWLPVYGGHGTHAIALSVSFLLSEEGREVWEALCALSDYPLLSDEALSDLEMRLEQEAWEHYGTHDLRRALSKRAAEEERPDLEEAFDDDDLPWDRVLTDAVYDQTWSRESGYASELHAAWERHAPYCEDAVSCVLPIESWVESLSLAYLEELVTTAREQINAWTVRGAYACLGCREKSAEGKHGAQERLFNTGEHECHYPGCPDASRPGLASTAGNVTPVAASEGGAA